MPTLNALKELSENKVNKAKALEAALHILRFYTLFHTEHHLIEDKIEEAQSDVDEIDAGVHGVNQTERGALMEFILEQKGRLDLLDGKLRAFEANDLNIKPPTQEMVAQVKRESARVAVLQTKDNALDAIVAGLVEIAQIADKSSKP